MTMIQEGGSSYGGIDFQCSMMDGLQSQPQFMNPHHHHGSSSVHPPAIHELTMVPVQNCDQTLLTRDLGQGKAPGSDEEEELSITEEGVDGMGNKGMPWQRVKWVDTMVKLLINAVSYIGEDMASDYSVGGRRKYSALQKKGKWKFVSVVMGERGYHVSPQQCEDKFNDLNKKYKKLNDMLGRGTSCRVVENPALLDVIDYLTDKEKDDVRKILSSKQLFYEEMCSYNNGNRLYLPHDPKLQRSMHLAVKSKDGHDHNNVRRVQHYDNDDDDDDDQDMEIDDRDDSDDDYGSHADARGMYGGFAGISSKILKRPQVHENIDLGNSINSIDHNGIAHPNKNAQTDVNHMFSEDARSAWLQKKWIESRKRQLEKQKLQIQVEMLELDKQRFKWAMFNKKKDCELEKLRMENEKMKLENEHMATELKQMEMNATN